MIDERSKVGSAPRAEGPERSDGTAARGAEPDPQVPVRRRFSAEFKAAIVAEAERCRDPGAIGALLRREGLYSSHLAAWRQQLRRGGVEGLKRRKRGPAPKPRPSAREIALERETRRLRKKLAKAELIIDFQKKVHGLLGIPLKSLPAGEDD
jgi:transposase-like protein